MRRFSLLAQKLAVAGEDNGSSVFAGLHRVIERNEATSIVQQLIRYTATISDTVLHFPAREPECTEILRSICI
jgi:hypothetical protein